MRWLNTVGDTSIRIYYFFFFYSSLVFLTAAEKVVIKSIQNEFLAVAQNISDMPESGIIIRPNTFGLKSKYS